MTTAFGPPDPESAGAAAAWEAERSLPGAPESSARSVQNVLLSLGGVLLAVAAVAFTVVAWGAFGIGGRAVILAVITALALALPGRLHRRGLGSTAETIALLALLLVGLDGYAVWYVGWAPTGVHPTGYAGAVVAVVALVAVGYPALVPVRTLRPAGVWLAQVAAVLLAAPVVAGAADWAVLTLAMAGADLATCWLIRDRDRIVLGAAALAAGLSAGAAALLALGAVAFAPAWGAPLTGTAVLAGLAALVLAVPETLAHVQPRYPSGVGAHVVYGLFRMVAAGVATVLVLPGPVLLWSRFGPAGWELSGLAGAALGAGLVGLAARGPWRWGVAQIVTLLAAGLSVDPLLGVARALIAPLGSLDLVWRAQSIAAPVSGVLAARPSVDLIVALVATLGAGAAGLASLAGRPGFTWVGSWRRPFLLAGAGGVAALALLGPAAAQSPVWVAVLASAVAAAAATTAGAVRASRYSGALLGLGAVLGGHALILGLVHPALTLAVLAAVAVGYAWLAWSGRPTAGPVPRRHGGARAAGRAVAGAGAAGAGRHGAHLDTALARRCAARRRRLDLRTAPPRRRPARHLRAAHAVTPRLRT